jgi:CRP-like cAMP-binding protein
MFIETPLHNLRNRMLAIRSLPNFEGLGEDSLLRIAEHARERRFRAGEPLYVEGTPVDRIYIVLSGAVTTSRQGKTFLVITGNGAAGILSAIAHDPDGWHAVADRDTLTLEIPVPVFLASLKEDFGLLRNALRRLSAMALASRGNLPARPDPTKEIDLGEYPDRDPTLVELIMRLRTTPGPFATANMDALIAAARRMTFVRVDAGHQFFEVGDPSDYSLRIVYGKIRCTSGSGEHVDVGAGFVLGALDAWGGAPRSFSARAETPVVCYRTPTEDLLSVLEMHPSLALQMLQGVASGLIKTGLSR